MAWVKIPAEHHPLFLAALPKDPRVSTVKMFGGVAAMVNGNMFGGLFARSIIARLSSADQARANALDGTTVFDPMGNGRTMKDTLVLAEEVMDDPAEMRAWLQRALAYTATLPPKKKKPPAAEKAAPGKAKPAAARAKATARPTKVGKKPTRAARK